jgi:protein-L-isoaspartate O-methyltransferase
MELIYSTTTLVTAVDDNLAPVSLSTKPDLMVRMLEALNILPGQRILEIGTGTGYNAALLAHRLGDHNVFSIDIDAELIDTARRRLANIGRHPRLDARDGAHGWPQHAPYDRIIATCAVRRIPWAWYGQLTLGGRLLVDFKPNGVGDLEAGFTARYGAFMLLRHDHHNPVDTSHSSWRPELPPDWERRTTTPAEPPGVVRFLRMVTSTIELRQRYTFDTQTRQPTAIRLTAADGSCCEVALIPDANGTRAVREGGPTPLWAELEHVYQQWQNWGEPGWNRVGVTISPQTQQVWLDEPHNIIGSVP